ncbi:MAG: GTPase Era [Erysipelotrichaceae bacterium]|nr:GTPase Era [Erysipelotrichaceae bacterium]
MKTGFVGLIGRPNVGKSTLINTLIGEKIAIVSKKPQTTRNIIKGIYNDSDSQIVFVDTPGIHKPNHKLGTYLNKQAYYTIDDNDVLLFLVSAKEEWGRGDDFVLERLKITGKPIILVINKIDLITKEELYLKIDSIKDKYDFKAIVPISAMRNDNVDRLIKVIKEELNEGPIYYDQDEYTTRSVKFLVAEIIREKIFNLTEKEIPHGTTVMVEAFERSGNSYVINASIIVDRASIKKIIVGAHGSMIKEIGIEARKDIEALLNKKVYLDLFVKVIPKWRDKDQYLSEFGFEDFKENE